MDHLRNHVAAMPERRYCDTHGEYQSHHLIGSVWSKCRKCEEERRASELQAEADRTVKAIRERLQAKLGQAAIPKRFIGRTFDNFEAVTPNQRAALTIAREYAEQFDQHAAAGTGLIFSGNVGTGKSHLAAAILQSQVERRGVFYATCADLIRMVRETWRKGSAKSEREVLRFLSEIDLLAIDEVGVQYGTESEQHTLFDVLDLRWREVKPTLLLTNQDAAGLKTYLGERTFDRLRDTCRMVPFTWTSHRGLGRTEAQQ